MDSPLIANGEKMTELLLESARVWGGRAAASGRVYLSLMDGEILCFGPR